MDKATKKNICQTGALDVLRKAIAELLLQDDSIEYNPDPYRLIYQVGKRDGKREGYDDLLDFFKNHE